MALSVDEYVQTMCNKLYNDATYSVYLDMATDMTNVDFFGDFTNLAIALRASHMYTVDTTRKDAVGGVIVGQASGRDSLRFWNSSKSVSVSDLNLTTFGMRLRVLMKTMGAVASVGNPEVL